MSEPTPTEFADIRLDDSKTEAEILALTTADNKLMFARDTGAVYLIDRNGNKKKMIEEGLWGANSLLKADTAGTVVSLDIPEDRVCGRLAGGVIAGLTSEQLAGFLNSTLDDVAQNGPTLSREIDVSGGNITGILGGGKPLDAVNLSQLKTQSMGCGSVLSVLDAAPTLATEVVGNKYLVGVGTGDFLAHNNEIAAVVSHGVDTTNLIAGGTILAKNDKSIAYAPDKKIYAVVGADGFSYSYDGLVFYSATTPSVEFWTKVIYVHQWKKFLACNSSGDTYSFATSTDAKNWAGHTATVKGFKGLAYLPGTDQVFALSSDGTPRLSYSSDGETWGDSGVVISLEDWTIANYSIKHEKLVATNTSSASDQFGYSSDGLSWEYSSPGQINAEGIIAFGDRVIICGQLGDDRVAYTDDLSTWVNVEVAASDTGGWKAIAEGRGVLYMVATTETSAYSLDGGDTWTIKATEATNFRDIIFSAERGEFAAIGRTGTYRSFVTDHIKDFLFRPPAEGDALYRIDNKWFMKFEGGVWRERLDYTLKATTTLPAGTGTDDAIMYLDPSDTAKIVDMKNGYASAIFIELQATLRDAGGMGLIHGWVLWGEDNVDAPTWETKIERINDSPAVIDLTPAIAINVTTGNLEITCSHSTVSSAAETIVDYTAHITGALNSSVGDPIGC